MLSHVADSHTRPGRMMNHLIPVTMILPTRRGRAEFKLALDIGESIQKEIGEAYARGIFYEQETSMFLLRALEPGDVVLDLGANAGYFTALAGHLVGPEGRVVAFEPNPRNVERLKANLGLNQLSVQVVMAAVGGNDGEVLFRDNGPLDSNGAIHTKEDDGAARARSFRVRQVSLDSCLPVLDLPKPPRLLKIDVDGAELLALTGARDLLARAAPDFIICEINENQLGRFGATCTGLRQYLRSFGYETFRMDHSGDLPTLIPADVEILAPYSVNLLFSRMDAIAGVWRQVTCLPALAEMKRRSDQGLAVAQALKRL